jgi:MFS family permease
MTGGRSPRDRVIIYAATFLRAVATGMVSVLVGLYLAQLRFSATLIGVVVTGGLLGGALAALLATVAADRLGRRRFLFGLALLSAAGGFVVALGSGAAVLAVAAFFGMLNGMGRDRGASVVIEQAILPSTGSDRERTAMFAMYNVLQAGGAALGALMAGVPTFVQQWSAISELSSMRLAIGLYAFVMLLTALLYPGLSGAVETRGASIGMRHVSVESRKVVFKLSALFALDSIGGGFLTQALIAYFFAARFGVTGAMVGILFSAAAVANAASQFGAAFLARRIGLVNTMVFTHIPGNLLLVVVALSPNFSMAAAFYLLRESLVQMDVPARQSYVMAVVRSEERTFASGVTGLVRLAGWALAPGLAGFFMEGVSLGTPLIVGPALKVLYDILLYRAFGAVKPPEEMESPKGAQGIEIEPETANPGPTGQGS